MEKRCNNSIIFTLVFSIVFFYIKQNGILYIIIRLINRAVCGIMKFSQKQGKF